MKMEPMLILSILVVGLSGLVAQGLLLRELLVSFFGNELTIGIILANWVAAEALGVFLAGKLIDRVENKINIFIALEVIFSLLLPLSIYLSRTYKIIAGIPIGEAIGLSAIFFWSFLIILPVSFCHGALFSVGCKISSLYSKESAASIGRVYTWETIGTILGGIILTYIFIPFLNSFQITFTVSLANLFICFFLIRRGRLKVMVFVGIVLSVCLVSAGALDYLQKDSLEKQFKTGMLLDYRNSVYGNIALTRQKEQYTFFYNGIPVITSPFPDIQFVQDFGHLPLLFHEKPEEILVISSGAGGLINEALKHPLKNIDYAELDPLIISLLKKYPTELTEAELTDKRVNVKNVDGRYFLKSNPKKYDLILIGLSSQADLTTNRFFTQEFFALAKDRLRPEGIFAFWLPGSLTYLSRQLKDLNACVLNGLKDTFAYVRAIPGDYNIFLGSSSKAITEATPALISQRIAERKIKGHAFTPRYLEYRLKVYWQDWFDESLSGATEKANRDFLPFAVFQTLVLWNKKFSQSMPQILQAFGSMDLRGVFLAVFLLTFVLTFLMPSRSKKIAVTYAIATTGFFGMLSNLVLIFAYQVFYGYLYHRIGILISVFMAGIAAGSILMSSRYRELRDPLGTFMRLEAFTASFPFVMAIVIFGLPAFQHFAWLIFMVLFFLAGLLIGLEFPLAGRIYLQEKLCVGEASGALYAADLLGGWLAGVLGGIILLPVLGLFNTCLVIAGFKLSSLFLVFLATLKKNSLTRRVI